MSNSTVRYNHYFLDQDMPAVKPLPLDLRGMGWWDRTKTVLTFKRKWELVEDYVLYVPWLDMRIFVPKGFAFDFASVPRVLWPLLSPTGILLLASVPHDFGYRYGGLLLQAADGKVYFKKFSKAELDTLLATITTVVCCSTVPGTLAKTGLALGGWVCWNAARKEGKNATTDYAYHLGI